MDIVYSGNFYSQGHVQLQQGCTAEHSATAFVLPISARTLPRSQLAKAQDDLSRAEPDSFVNKLSVAVMNSPLNQFKQSIAKIGVGEYDATVLNKQIDAYIKQNKVMVFSWTGCPFCRKANALLAELMEPSQFFVLQIDEMDQGKAIRYELSQKTGRTSVPQIWIN
eukprot:11046-Heterococcus_DN1.PRE.1